MRSPAWSMEGRLCALERKEFRVCGYLLSVHVSESFPYTRGRLWFGVCLPGQYAQLYVSVWLLGPSGCVLGVLGFSFVVPTTWNALPHITLWLTLFTFFSV